MQIVAPLHSPYSPIENLMRPFNVWLFVALVGILFTGSVAIFFLRKLKIQDKSLGTSLNLIVIFFGGSQTKLPTKTSLRTLYQASLFAIMQIEETKPGITPVDEMVDKKFKFFLTTSFGQQTNDLKFHQR